MSFFSSKKQAKAKRLKEEYERSTGLPYVQEGVFSHSHRITKLLINGFLVYIGSFGTLLFYASSFQVAFNEPVVAFVLLLVSLYCAFLYYNSLVKNLGYVLLLFVFVGLALSFRGYANSGFSAIYNITYDAIDQALGLPAVRHMAEQIEERYESVTICFCFLGSVGAIWLNTAVSHSMNLWGALYSTFPFLAIGLYFDRTPHKMAVLLVLTFYLSLVVLRSNYSIDSETSVRRKRAARRSLVYPTDGKAMGQMALAVFALALVLSFTATLLLPRQSFHVPKGWGGYKEKMDERVKTFMTVGFSGFFNRYDAKGGVNGGRLGGVASIRPSFKTDLIVRFAPYQADTVYLKSFTGTNYQYDHWESVAERTDASEASSTVEGLTQNEVAYNLESLNYKERFEMGDEFAIMGRMEVKNVNANVNFPYLPYYAYATNSERLQCVDKDVVKGSSPIGETDVYSYYQSFQPEPSLYGYGGHSPDLDYYNLPYDLYLRLSDFASREIGLSQYEPTERTIQKLMDYFEKHYPYSMSPGATPRNKDFVSYFLFENKRGYCAHFASAATLLFRTMGIPARYVEGYAIPYSRVLDSDLLEGESYEDWLAGNAPLGQTAVVEVEVNDSMAHAWVEVWSPQRGWYPVEATVGAFLQEDAGLDFWSFFRDVFGGEGDTGGGASNALPALNENSKRVLYRAMTLTVSCVAAFFFLFYAYLYAKLYLGFYTKDVNAGLSNRYTHLCRSFARSYDAFAQCRDQSEQIRWMRSLYERHDAGSQEALPFSVWEDALKRACYSPHQVSQEEYEASVRVMKHMRRLLFRSVGIPMKIKLLF